MIEPRAQRQDGFALLALVFFIAAGSAALASLVGLMHVGAGGRAALTEQRLAHVRGAAQEGYLRNGVFPADLAALITAAVVDPDAAWRFDPHAGSQELAYAVAGSPAIVTITSRGPDSQLGTGDDVAVTLDENGPGRSRTRNRLRILRAAYLRSGYMDAASMSPAERQTMRDAVAAFASNQRRLLHADAGTQATLTADRDNALSTIAALRSLHSLPAPPANATGVGGLLAALSLPDSLGTDGFGSILRVDAHVGFISNGGDRTAGGIDDL